MIGQKEKYKAVTGKTYTLFGDDVSTDRYYSTIRNILDNLLLVCPDKQTLLSHIQKAGSRRQLFKKSSGLIDLTLLSFIRKNVHEKLSAYTRGVKEHLRSLSPSQRFDETLRTKEKQYHLYMLEIELINRIYKEAFKERTQVCTHSPPVCATSGLNASPFPVISRQFAWAAQKNAS